MNHLSRSTRASSVVKNSKIGAMAWLTALVGLQFACSSAGTTVDAIGGATSVSGGAPSSGGSTTSNATGGTSSATGGASLAIGGSVATSTSGSKAQGGTTGSPSGGTTSTANSGGTSVAAGGTVSTGGTQAIGGRGGATTGGGTAKASGGSSIQAGGTTAAGGSGLGSAAGKASVGGTASRGGTTGVGGTAGATGGVAGKSSTSTSTDEYCPASEPCRISPLGDSITEGMGWNYPTGGGYRSKLFSLGLKDAKNFTFVGTRSNGPNTVDSKPFPKNHEGTSGITIQDLQKNVVDKGALTGAAVKPHIILLHIGTNNLSGGTATGNIALLSSLIDSVTKSCPDALLVVAKIIPFNGSEKGYNDLIPALVDTKAKAGAHIILVDQSTGFLSSDIADGVHPNEGGYAKMAGVWYKAISQYLH